MYSGREFRSLRMWYHANGCAVPTKTVLHPKRSESSTTLTNRTSDLILYPGFQFYGIWHCFNGQGVLLDCLTTKMNGRRLSGAYETAHSTTCHIPVDLNTQHYSWIKIDQLDVTCFIISLFTAQHVSNVSTSIFRSLPLIVDLFHVLYCSGSMCVGVTVWFGWGK